LGEFLTEVERGLQRGRGFSASEGAAANSTQSLEEIKEMKLKGPPIFMMMALAIVALALSVGQTSAERRKPSPEQIGNAIKARSQADPDWLQNFTPGAQVMAQATPQGGTVADITRCTSVAK